MYVMAALQRLTPPTHARLIRMVSNSQSWELVQCLGPTSSTWGHAVCDFSDLNSIHIMDDVYVHKLYSYMHINFHCMWYHAVYEKLDCMEWWVSFSKSIHEVIAELGEAWGPAQCVETACSETAQQGECKMSQSQLCDIIARFVQPACAPTIL
jgi:hypothetical protein